MVLAFGWVAAILFLICAVFPPYDAPSWPGRLVPLGLFFLTLYFVVPKS